MAAARVTRVCRPAESPLTRSQVAGYHVDPTDVGAAVRSSAEGKGKAVVGGQCGLVSDGGALVWTDKSGK